MSKVRVVREAINDSTASKNSQGQTAADVRLKELRMALTFAEKTVKNLHALIDRKPPAGGFHWGYAGDAEHLSNEVGDAWALSDQLVSHDTTGKQYRPV